VSRFDQVKSFIPVAAALLATTAQAAAADMNYSSNWSGFYIGLHGGYGHGQSDATIPGAGGTTQEFCRTNAFGDLPLVDAPAGSVFDSALTGNQSYPGIVSSILGLAPISGSSLLAPTSQTAWDFRGQTPFVTDDECIFHTAYAENAGTYYGGRQGVPSFPIAGLPTDFVPQDSSGTIVTTTTPGTSDVDVSTDLSGFIGGVQAGWNNQFGPNTLFGVEGDFALSGVDGDTNVGAGSAETDLDWLGSLRARLGFASGNVFIYATGGAAWANTSFSYNNGTNTGSDSDTQFGWTAGGGAEFLIAENLTLKAEYKYFDLGEASYRVNGANVEADLTLNTFIIGLNKRF
jgi:outer membrane immunogenic protein